MTTPVPDAERRSPAARAVGPWREPRPAATPAVPRLRLPPPVAASPHPPADVPTPPGTRSASPEPVAPQHRGGHRAAATRCVTPRFGASLAGPRRYLLDHELGVGAFGVVSAYVDRATEAQVAIKTIAAEHVRREHVRVVREVDLLIRLRGAHRNVMAILDGYVTFHCHTHTAALAVRTLAAPAYTGLTMADDDAPHAAVDPTQPPSDPAEMEKFDVHLVMPRMHVDLYRFTRASPETFPLAPTVTAAPGGAARFHAHTAAVLAFQSCCGVAYLHACKIFHRDLKPQNILVNVDFADPTNSLAVVADFGLAREFAAHSTHYVCTRNYRAPELTTHVGPYDGGVDVWALGCTLYELCTGCTLCHLNTTSRDANGAWNGGLASVQLEALLDIIGCPAPDDVAALMPECPVKSYLASTRDLRTREGKGMEQSHLRARFDAQFRLHVSPAERDEWFGIIESCLRYFPSQRPTAAQLCTAPLFATRYQLVPPSSAVPPFDYAAEATPPSRVPRENRAIVRGLLGRFGPPPPVPPPTPVTETPSRPIVDDTADVQAAIGHVTASLAALPVTGLVAAPVVAVDDPAVAQEDPGTRSASPEPVAPQARGGRSAGVTADPGEVETCSTSTHVEVKNPTHDAPTTPGTRSASPEPVAPQQRGGHWPGATADAGDTPHTTRSTSSRSIECVEVPTPREAAAGGGDSAFGDDRLPWWWRVLLNLVSKEK